MGESVPIPPVPVPGRVAFLARKVAIEAALLAGHTIRAVYDDHRAAIPVSYGQFVRYVARFLPAAYAEHAHAPRAGTRPVRRVTARSAPDVRQTQGPPMT